jgi:hypothetical protein
MKKPLVLATAAGFAVVLVGAAFAAFTAYSHARDVREYLPAQPRVAGVKIDGSAVQLGPSVASRSFRFTATSAATAADAARLFEPQLASEGWERLASSTDGGVASSSWRHREKINQGLYLVFAVAQLDPSGEYLASMTTAPYWPRP